MGALVKKPRYGVTVKNINIVEGMSQDEEK